MNKVDVCLKFVLDRIHLFVKGASLYNKRMLHKRKIT